MAAGAVDLEGGLPGGVLDDPALVPAGPLLLDRPPQLVLGRVDLEGSHKCLKSVNLLQLEDDDQTCMACKQQGQQHPWQLSGLTILKTSWPLMGSSTGIWNDLVKTYFELG